jgi:exopolysaccharide biosynthesis polyprenyl glycosylphosphotransferase
VSEDGPTQGLGLSGRPPEARLGSVTGRRHRLAARPKRDYVRRRLLAAADALAIASGFVLLFGLAGPAEGGGTRLAWALPLIPGWIVVFKLYGLYDRDGKRVSHSTVDDLPWLFHALVTSALASWLVAYAADVAVPSPALVLVAAAWTLAALGAARATVRVVAARLLPPERCLFVGGGSVAALLVHKIRAHPEYGLEPIGYVDAAAGASAAAVAGMPRLGALAELADVCAREGVERLVVASPAVEEDELADVVRVASGLDVRISILARLSGVLGPAVSVDDVEGLTVLGLNPPTLTPSSRLLKRLMDLTVATVAIVVTLPVLTVAAVLVKTTSPGPILYAQERVGRQGRRFRIFKLRTMAADADARVDELRRASAHPAWLLLEDDPRVTRVGRWLRRTSIDELPQLWNVLRGDMSLVGPRPMSPDVDEHISGWGRRRLDLTPGITGLWQVLGRTSIPFEEMVKLDYLYVTNWSLWQDVRLLIRTLPVVVRQRGAN